MLENDLIFTQTNGVRLIKFNRPAKKNAINRNMYETLTRVLNEDAENDKIVVTIITGAGDYYSSGTDLMDTPKNSDNGLEKRFQIVKNTVDAIINYPKLLIAVVNGPAVGIAATTAALCDIVYASDRATFDTPFVKLGLCAEGASSFTFPSILGKSKASEVLLLNHKLTAQEAYQFNFVSKVIPHNEINNFIQSLKQFGQLSPNSVKITKNLITRNFKHILKECNTVECNQLIECSQSEEFINNVMKFMSRKSKL